MTHIFERMEFCGAFRAAAKTGAVMGLVLVLASCGGRLAVPSGGGPVSNSRAPSGVESGAALPFASGPIQSACARSGRAAASRQLCGCVQAAANGTLSNGDQRLAVSFYANPQRGQDVRQSDNPSNEAFWQRYRMFVDRAERQCAAAR